MQSYCHRHRHRHRYSGAGDATPAMAQAPGHRRCARGPTRGGPHSRREGKGAPFVRLPLALALALLALLGAAQQGEARNFGAPPTAGFPAGPPPVHRWLLAASLAASSVGWGPAQGLGFKVAGRVKVRPKQAGALGACLRVWGGPPLQGWRDPWTCAEVQGVNCNGRGDVIALQLPGALPKSNAGSLPRALGVLTALKDLDLSSNGLTGSIPGVVGVLSRLTSLQLQQNNLNGTLPRSLGRLRRLQVMRLLANNFSGSIPEELGQLTGLEDLELNNNRLSGSIPGSLGNLTALTSLYIWQNLLGGSLPASLGRLTNLLELFLYSNRLSGTLPRSLGRLTALYSLYLGSNNFTGSLPGSLENLEGLAEFSAPMNLLEGPIPSAYSLLYSLEVLNLRSNRLSGSLPPSLGELTGLTSIDLGQNQFTGHIPESVAGLTGLETLDLSYNALNGTLPKRLGALSALTQLALEANELSGRLPPSFSALTNLRSLTLRANNLSGAIPPAIGRFTQLNALDLSDNSFTGNIPPSMRRLRGLPALTLQGNSFSGPIPSGLADLTALTALDLSRNRLTGGIPEALVRLGGLQSLDVSGNRLGGSIPGGVARMQALTSLQCRGNRIAGGVPSALGRLSGLQALDLSSNRLTGSLPDALGGLAGLTLLSVSHNQLTGTVPGFLSRLRGLVQLDLSGNDLEGPLSALEQLNTLPALEGLGLGLQGIQGSLPNFISQLQRLTALSFASANLSGTLPAFLRTLSELHSLVLAPTALSGGLPSSLALLSELSFLDLPPTITCPPPPCRNSAVARNAAVCQRCAAFCSLCPLSAPDPAITASLLQFQAASGCPGTWTNASLDGVRVVNKELVQLSVTRQDCGRAPLDFSALGASQATLSTLVLSNDRLSGEFPSSIGNLTALRRLDLSSNQLAGPLPESFRRLSALRRLDLSQQALSGVGTEQGVGNLNVLRHMRALTFLSLSSSQTLGVVPRTLTLLSDLEFLDLSSNAFIGDVPQGLSRLRKLTYLSLLNNQKLVLPTSLATLPLVVFDVSPPFRCASRPPKAACPPVLVNSSSPFCTQYCPQACTPCYRPPPPPSPPHPPPPPQLPPPPSPPPPAPGFLPQALPQGALVAILIVCVGGFIGILVTVTLVLWSWRRPEEDGVVRRGVRVYLREALEEATEGFSASLGREGGWELFEGTLRTGEAVVVKRARLADEAGRGGSQPSSSANPNSNSVTSNFKNEIKLLSLVHHRHVLALLGYCLTPKEVFLVYELAARGSLQNILRDDPECLTWARRLGIALGTAEGLSYLHSQISPPIVHRDVKSASILVTSDFQAKLGGFRTSRLATLPGQAGSEVPGSGGTSSQVPASSIEGTRGYLDPFYVQTGVPTPASDVYSFGIVLLELATGMPALDRRGHLLSKVLAVANSEAGPVGAVAESLQAELQESRALRGLGEGEEGGEGGEVEGGGEAVPRSLLVEGSELVTEAGLEMLLGLALSCCSLEPEHRPSMAQVVDSLERIRYGRHDKGGEGSGGEGGEEEMAGSPGEEFLPFPEYEEGSRGETLNVTITSDVTGGDRRPRRSSTRMSVTRSS